jgi:hypothetical protein
MVTGTADNGRENRAGRIITGETGLAHAGAIVDNEGGNFFLHFDRLERCKLKKGRIKYQARAIPGSSVRVVMISLPKRSGGKRKRWLVLRREVGKGR